MDAKNQDPPPYMADEDAIIERALDILRRRVHAGPVMNSPKTVRDFLTVRAAGLEHEEFAVVFLTSQHHVICVDTMFTGTLSQTSVYPREIVKAALRCNAGAVILTHNHPSGVPEPSRADEILTQTLKAALNMVDVRILDHIVTAGGASVSMAERGLI